MFRDIRDTMMRNEWHEGCFKCKADEDAGKTSMRTEADEFFDDFTDTVELQYLEITVGRLCNLACVSCDWSCTSDDDDARPLTRSCTLNYPHKGNAMADVWVPPTAASLTVPAGLLLTSFFLPDTRHKSLPPNVRLHHTSPPSFLRPITAFSHQRHHRLTHTCTSTHTSIHSTRPAHSGHDIRV